MVVRGSSILCVSTHYKNQHNTARDANFRQTTLIESTTFDFHVRHNRIKREQASQKEFCVFLKAVYVRMIAA